jgi:hypothetical protein
VRRITEDLSRDPKIAGTRVANEDEVVRHETSTSAGYTLTSPRDHTMGGIRVRGRLVYMPVTQYHHRVFAGGLSDS